MAAHQRRRPGGWVGVGGNPWQAQAGATDFTTAAAARNPTPAHLDAAQALGLRWPCTADVAKAAYRRLAAEHHPDRSAGAEATERMARINVAWQVVQRGLDAA